MQQIDDGSSLSKYATHLPNMADDDLGVYQYRLYAHYKRVCGALGGECYEKAQTTADKTGMGRTMVIKTRQELEEAGWIICTSQGIKKPVKIHIVDRWPENMARYAKSSSPHDMTRSPHDMTRSPHDINMSQGERKEEPIKKNQGEEPAKKFEPVLVDPWDKDDELKGRVHTLISESIRTFFSKARGSAAKDLKAEPYVDLAEFYGWEAFVRGFNEALADKFRTAANPEHVEHFIVSKSKATMDQTIEGLKDGSVSLTPEEEASAAWLQEALT